MLSATRVHPQRVVVTRLQGHDTKPRAFLERFVGLELLARLFVKAVEIPDGKLSRGAIFTEVDEVFDEHAERRSPVPDVVLTNDPVPDEFEHADEGIADHGGPEVADVHFLCHVRRRVVDNDVLRGANSAYTEEIVRKGGSQLFGDEVRRENHIHEAGTCNIDRLAHIGHVSETLENVVGDVAWWTSHGFCDCERAVDLRIGMFARANHRIDIAPCDGTERIGEPSRKKVEGISHVVKHCCRPDAVSRCQFRRHG